MTETQWSRIASHISFTYIHGSSVKMEHHKQEVYGVYYIIAKWNYNLQ